MSAAKNWLNRIRGLEQARRVRSATSILARKQPPDCERAQSAFDKLQAEFDPRPEYGYDPESLERRASKRLTTISAHLPPSSPHLHGFELGAGDGLLGVKLAKAGMKMTLSDLDDWRTPEAKALPFLQADACDGLAVEDNQFDFVLSFNSFEHFADPASVFHELWRITKPGGLLYFDFGPLYCSPWGLHAYRALRMPYAQFLFEPGFVNQAIEQIGIWDLGKKRTILQHVNRWTAPQFDRLWNSRPVKIRENSITKDDAWISIVSLFPSSFQGRGLTVNDLVSSQLKVCLEK